MRIRRGEIETIETRQITSYDTPHASASLRYAFDRPSIGVWDNSTMIRYAQNRKRVCQNRHILLFVFLQARHGKILSMPLF